MTPRADEPTRRYNLAGQSLEAPALAAGLYVVSTPIGNLGDVTVRALATLAAADLIACEDTRITSRLTRHYGIATPLFPYHEHNAQKQRPKLLAALAEGRRVALVSDAGTPLVSDPGFRLVGEAAAAGHAIVPVPGASALLAGLAAAGLPTDTFLFAGFLPPKAAARRSRLQELASVPATLVFYESPRRLAAALADMAAVLGDRPAAIARELTKAFEEIRRGRLAGLAAALASEEEPLGEVTLVVGPPEATVPAAGDIDAALTELLAGRSVGEAAAELAARTGLPRRQLYARALALRPPREADDA